MAVLVDEQNAGEPGYVPMSKDLEHSPSFRAALDLVFSGREEPNGYTERASRSGGGGEQGGGTAPRTGAATAPAPPCSRTMRPARPDHRHSVAVVLELRTVPYDHPDVERLVRGVQAEYVQRYGGEDAAGGAGGVRAAARSLRRWLCRRRARRLQRMAGRDALHGDGALRDGDAEIKRMFVPAGHRGGASRVPCSPSWNTSRPPRAGVARCWRPGRASPRRSRCTRAPGTPRSSPSASTATRAGCRCFAKHLSSPGPHRRSYHTSSRTRCTEQLVRHVADLETIHAGRGLPFPDRVVDDPLGSVRRRGP